MSKGAYGCIDNVSRKVTQIPLCIDGVSRNTKEGCTCIDGVSRKFFGGGAQMSSLSLGDSVFMNVNGVRKEFLIVHKGCPSSASGAFTNASYSNADGIWLLMKDIYTKMTWSSSDYDSYANSTIHNYLNTTFLDFLDEGVSSKILQAGLPYATSSIDLGSISAKVFLLSAYELNLQAVYSTNEGGILQYFNSSYQVASGVTDLTVRRTAYYNGTTESWWTRTHSWGYFTNVIVHGDNGRPDLWGTIGTSGSSYSCGIRPAMIFPYGTLVDSNFNIIV